MRGVSKVLITALSAMAVAWVSTPDAHAADEVAKLRRFALIIGANDGGADRVQLQYATTDATAMAKVIGELGGVRTADSLLVLDPDKAALDRAFSEIAARLDRAKGDDVARLEMIVYYSGHSDEQGILLGGERISYKSLRAKIDKLPADVRIAILDSCASGALTRMKGGQRKPPFLVDASTEVKGHAFLTSSSADEVAQESDSLGASFFTHYLVSGLRGAADTTGDGRVTLNEAYQFAFHETLARTESTRSGAQHPAYDIQLTGTGDLVLTDLRGTGARMAVSEGVGGRIFIRDAGGILVVELFKQPGRVVELGLEPGRYDVTIEQKKTLRKGSIQLDKGRMALLTMAMLKEVPREATVSRGDAPEGEVEKPDEGYVHVPFSISILPALSYPLSSSKQIHHFALSIGIGYADKLQGTQISAGGNWINEDIKGLQIAGGFNITGEQHKGTQIAGGFNRVGGDMRGAQIAGGINLLQGQGRLAQVTGGGNIALRSVFGTQVAGGFNYTQDALDGAQVAGGFNMAIDNARGVQVAGGFNYTGQMRGLQLSPVNIASAGIDGVQIGVVNIGGAVKGTQIGLINISDSMEGVPIGLINVVRDGQFHLDAWTSDVMPFNLGFRFGSKQIYTMLVCGFEPVEKEDDPLFWFAGIGVGGHIPLDRFFIDLDLIAGQLRQGDILDHTNILTRARAAFGLQIFDHLAIYGGVALNFWIADQFDRERFNLGPSLDPIVAQEEPSGLVLFGGDAGKGERSGTTLGIWPGFFAGVQF